MTWAATAEAAASRTILGAVLLAAAPEAVGFELAVLGGEAAEAASMATYGVLPGIAADVGYVVEYGISTAIPRGILGYLGHEGIQAMNHAVNSRHIDHIMDDIPEVRHTELTTQSKRPRLDNPIPTNPGHLKVNHGGSMPRVYVRRVSGRRGRKRSGRRYTQKIVSRNITPTSWIPKTRKFKHTVSTSGVVIPAANGVCIIKKVKANSIKDPMSDLNGAGNHAPLFTDQLGDQYQRMLVTKASIRCDFMVYRGNDNDGAGLVAAAPQAAVCGIAISNNATGNLAHGAYEEHPDTVFATVPVGSSQTLIASVNPAQWLGSPNPLSDATVTATETTDPTRLLYFHLFAHDVKITGNVWADVNAERVYMHATCAYDITWFNPISQFARSTEA